jgi:hypothetical protein
MTLLFIYPLISFSQVTVVLNTYPKTVPDGKKWVIKAGQETLIEVSDRVLEDGSFCNARFLSDPRVIDGVVEGQYGRPNQVYTFLFKSVEKTAFANDYTYTINPLTIVDSRFKLSELASKPVESVGAKEVSFYPGQRVFVGGCLVSLQLYEFDLQKSDLQIIEQMRKETEEKNATSLVVENNPETEPIESSQEISDNEILTDTEALDQQPEFQGGYDEMVKFIKKNIQYSASVRRTGVNGVVFVSFIVRNNGSLTNIKTVRGINSDCDKEAERLVSIMPLWRPGIVDDKPVNVHLILPVHFKKN